jgi:hypothetical protein
MAILQPKVAIYSLMRKVKNGRIIQDTGTGGAYPVSSDRMICAVAAWTVYKITGDHDWLQKAYAIIKKSETYWAMASAKAGNEESVIRAISAIYRPATLWLTNKENFVAGDGDFAGTQINSSNMLWSLSGNIALVYKVLFGIHYNENSIQFKPFVPRALAGARSLHHFKYRDAWLNISMTGYGNQVKRITLDGTAITGGIIPAGLKGEHSINIILANNVVKGNNNLQPDYTAPETPVVTYAKGRLTWPKTERAVGYHVIKNGELIVTNSTLSYPVNTGEYAEYQVISFDRKGINSFASEPVQVIPAKSVQMIEAENLTDRSALDYKGFTGNGFVEISKTMNLNLKIPVKVDESGIYAVDFRYANGNGPINTENKCAIRTLVVDKEFAGTVVLPQRGKGEWSNWGYSNVVKMKLRKDEHMISLQLRDVNENMNGEINQAVIDHLRLIKLSAN